MHFPPSLRYPETQRNSMLSECLKLPTIPSVPQVLNTNRLPVCTTKVESAHQNRSGCAFTTIEDSYLSSSNEVPLALLYFLTYQAYISLSVFDLVYDTMLTTKGLAGATDTLHDAGRNDISTY
ncbi:hypothetical protein PHPALM_28917 [Phytophthora palmivora]|uniref:Uncharacterized protein n=1 Tax=Phytophthora palmivora TaxID=4796 RepID=A0A2P4X8V9_9STRA|nr:hypothetical protein PHPALM_28917 [Phytophthora palmivora]